MPALEAPALRAAGAEHPGHCPTWTPWATAKGQHCETLLGADDLPPDPARAGGAVVGVACQPSPEDGSPKGLAASRRGPGCMPEGRARPRLFLGGWNGSPCPANCPGRQPCGALSLNSVSPPWVGCCSQRIPCRHCCDESPWRGSLAGLAPGPEQQGQAHPGRSHSSASFCLPGASLRPFRGAHQALETAGTNP